jgi:3-oxoacyl-[acyl-carrier-protein] synthase-3
VCTTEGLTDLAEKAALTALYRANLKACELDLIICSTIAGDYIMPSLACAVSERLKTTCPAFDINAACAGFIYALDIAAAYIASGRAKNILIISADIMSSLVDWNDRGVSILFGDGAGACVVTPGNALKYMNLTAAGDIKPICQKSGTGNNPFAEVKENRGFMRMDGQEVFKFAVSSIEKEVVRALCELALTPEEIDYFVMHQANKRIIDSARKRLNQPEGKFPINIDRYGNTSSATIPVLLDEMVEDGRIKKGTALLLAAFGAGLATGACVLVWE